MAKGIILGKPGDADLPSPGDQLSEDDIRRAMDAVVNAPMTESGIVIPPHVAEERAPQQAGPNREQRRWAARQAKRRRRGRHGTQLDTSDVVTLARAERALQAAETQQVLSGPQALDRAHDAVKAGETGSDLDRLLRAAGAVELG